MRHNRLFVALLLLLTVGLTAPALAGEMTLDEVIAKNVEARGGLDAMNAIETFKMTGKMVMGGMEVPLVINWQRPDKIRVDVEMQGQQIIQAYDGENGWMVVPMMGTTDPQPMPEAQLEQMKEQADGMEGPLVNYAEKGHQVELVGKEDVEGTEAYKLKVTYESGREVFVFLDAEYFLEFQQQGEQDMMGQKVQMTTTLGDFKEVAGVMIPHAMESKAEGAPAGQAVTVEKIEVGVEFPGDFFTMPPPAPKEETPEEKADGR